MTQAAMDNPTNTGALSPVTRHPTQIKGNCPTCGHRHQSETGAALPSDGREALREASSNLAQQAGALIVATDGQSKIRNERQRVLNAVKDVVAALAQPVEAGEDGT